MTKHESNRLEKLIRSYGCDCISVSRNGDSRVYVQVKRRVRLDNFQEVFAGSTLGFLQNVKHVQSVKRMLPKVGG